MTTTRSPDIPDTSLARDILHAVRYYLRGRRGLFALAAVALVGGLAFNWSWLVAAGIAPLLLAVLPCVAMCALGLCMSRMAGRSCSTDVASEKTPGSSSEQAPSAPIATKPQLAEERRTTDA